ncbi:hypothetical protein [Natrarchaeobius oligotrophus]|uniref:Metal-dependent hydrolase n=1 Tax=Natrarchaeobius chitinivorans TaxID=1679083 RepID=A0A3N6MGC3_NATCH|nr:hypothetical protein [Natrarchaeobius chitinivorans]RQH03039.1 hypothetical protein EA472_00085 [Natrarchaeobius chitinivorans]
MHSKHHALVSLVVAAALVVVLPAASVAGRSAPAAAVVAYGIALGVFVDLDHFVIARYRTGSWDAVRFCLSNPTAAVVDQTRIFETGDVGVLSRLLSHLAILGVLVPLVAVVDVTLAIVTGVVLYAHVVSDVAWDIRRLPRDVEGATDDVLRAIR